MTRRKRRILKMFGYRRPIDPVQQQFNQYQEDTMSKMVQYYAESFVIFVYLAVGILHLDNQAPLVVMVFLACLWVYGFRLTLNNWWEAREWLDAMNDLPYILFRIRG